MVGGPKSAHPPGLVDPSPTSSPPLTSFSPPPSNCWKLARLQSDLPITLISRDGLADDGGNGGTGGIGGGGDRVGG